MRMTEINFHVSAPPFMKYIKFRHAILEIVVSVKNFIRQKMRAILIRSSFRFCNPVGFFQVKFETNKETLTLAIFINAPKMCFRASC